MNATKAEMVRFADAVHEAVGNYNYAVDEARALGLEVSSQVDSEGHIIQARVFKYSLFESNIPKR